MRKITLTIAAAALALGASSAAFAAPGNQPPGNPQAPVLLACDAGQGGVEVLMFVNAMKALEMPPGVFARGLAQADDERPGAGDFVQTSHAWCNHGANEYTPLP